MRFKFCKSWKVQRNCDENSSSDSTGCVEMCWYCSLFIFSPSRFCPLNLCQRSNTRYGGGNEIPCALLTALNITLEKFKSNISFRWQCPCTCGNSTEQTLQSLHWDYFFSKKFFQHELFTDRDGRSFGVLGTRYCWVFKNECDTAARTTNQILSLSLSLSCPVSGKLRWFPHLPQGPNNHRTMNVHLKNVFIIKVT